MKTFVRWQRTSKDFYNNTTAYYNNTARQFYRNEEMNDG